MKLEIHQLLLSLDQRNRWEYPAGFKRRKHLKEIQQIQQVLEARLEISLYLDHHVEDASFTADLGPLEEIHHQGSQVFVYLFCFRFSNFGRLFTRIGELTDETIEKYQLPLLVQLIGQNGFVFIPCEELDGALYDGLNQPYQTDLTWWTRYFDYL